MRQGELVKVLDHHTVRARGYGWAIGAVGSIIAQAHEKDFDAKDGGPIPAIKPSWYTVSVEHTKAKGGFAYATLPEEVLAPHACTSRCGKHLCR